MELVRQFLMNGGAACICITAMIVCGVVYLVNKAKSSAIEYSMIAVINPGEWGNTGFRLIGLKGARADYFDVKLETLVEEMSLGRVKVKNLRLVNGVIECTGDLSKYPSLKRHRTGEIEINSNEVIKLTVIDVADFDNGKIFTVSSIEPEVRAMCQEDLLVLQEFMPITNIEVIQRDSGNVEIALV